jgi:hypothetical protein
VDNQRAEISIFNYLSFSARLKQTNKQNKNEKKKKQSSSSVFSIPYLLEKHYRNAKKAVHNE